MPDDARANEIMARFADRKRVLAAERATGGFTKIGDLLPHAPALSPPGPDFPWPVPCEICGAVWTLSEAGRWRITHWSEPHAKAPVRGPEPVPPYSPPPRTRDLLDDEELFDRKMLIAGDR